MRLAFIDYDDSLMCSTFIYNNKNIEIDQTKHPIGTLDKKCCDLINKLRDMEFSIFIISNADHRWITRTGEKYLPTFLSTVNELSIPIISAKNRYEHIYPNDEIKWKENVFLDIIDIHEDTSIDLLIIGDSSSEMKASINIFNERNKDLSKAPLFLYRIKLHERPDIDTMLHQFNHMLDKIDTLLGTNMTHVELSFGKPHGPG